MIDTLLRASASLTAKTVLTASIDTAARSMGVVMDKTLWTSLTAKCNVQIEFSGDAGQTFAPISGGFVNEAGGSGNVLGITPIPPEQGQTRQARFTVTPSAPLITAITMRTLDGTEPRVLA